MSQYSRFAPSMVRRILFFGIILGLFSHSRAENSTAVQSSKLQVEGVGFDEKTATQNALRSAISKAAMSWADTTQGDKKKSFDQWDIHNSTKVDQYIKSYFVLRSQKEFGLVRVWVAVEVAKGSIRKSLQAQKLLYQSLNSPCIMVVLDERADGREMSERTASAMFEQALLKQKFRVFDQQQVEELKSMAKAKGEKHPELASLAFDMGADILIKGGVTAGKATEKISYGVKLFTVPVQLNVKVIRADNGEILISKSKRLKKNSREAFSSAQFGLEKGGEALASALIGELIDFWFNEFANSKIITLQISGKSLKSLQSIGKRIEKLEWVKTLSLDYYDKPVGSFSLGLAGSVQSLNNELSKDEWGLNTVSMSKNRLQMVAGKNQNKVSEVLEVPDGIEIGELTVQDIFPARVSFYSENPLLQLKIANTERGLLKDLRIQVYIPSLMSLPSVTKTEALKVGEDRRVEITVNLDAEKLLRNKVASQVMGQVVVKGVRGNKKVSRELSLPVTVLSRNAMDWLQPKSLAAFITNRDKVIDGFAKDVVQKIKYVENVNINLMQTMGLFAGLRELGFKYVKDPAGSPGRPGLDMVQYPRETLKLRTGDCDDTSVLMAALTTSLGIKTAVISYPDHVLIMINTEVFDKNRTALGADGKKMISHRGTLWVPVETTMIEKGFVAAWDEAIAEFLNAVKAGEAIQIIEVEEAWKNYQAVWLAGNQKVPDLKGILVEKAGATLQKHVVDSWRSKLDELKKLRVLSMEERNLMGVLYARLGEYDRAMKIFKKITRDNNIPKWLNNYGASIILSGSEEKALKILNKADSKEKLIGVAINRAICFYLLSQTTSNIEPFIKALKEASKLLPAGESLETYLGMNIMAKSSNKGANVTPKKSLINKRQMRELIRERILKSKNKPQKKRTQPTDNKNQKLVYGGIRGADPTQVAEIMDLLYWYEK